MSRFMKITFVKVYIVNTIRNITMSSQHNKLLGFGGSKIDKFTPKLCCNGFEM